MAIAATLVARLKANTGDFNKKMRKSSKRTRSFLKSIKGAALGLGKFAAVAGGVAVAAVVQLVRSQGALIDSMAKLSQQTKIDIEDIAGLRLAADITGSSAANMDKSLQKLGKNIGDAARGTGEAKDAIRDLGISIFSLALQSPSEQLRTIADAFSGLTSQAKKASIAQALFGRSGSQLIPLLESGSAGINGFTNEAKKFGTAISKKTAAKVESLNDSLRRMGEMFSGLKTQILVEIAPKLTRVFESLRKSIEDQGGALNVLGKVWDKFASARQQTIRVFEIGISAVKVGIFGLTTAFAKSIAFILEKASFVENAVNKLLGVGDTAFSSALDRAAKKTDIFADRQAAKLKANVAVLKDLVNQPEVVKPKPRPKLKKPGKDFIGPFLDKVTADIGKGILSGVEKVVEGKKVLDAVVGKAAKFVKNFKAPKAEKVAAVKRETIQLAAPSAIEAGSFAAIKAGRKEDRRFKTTLEVMKDQLGKLSSIDKRLGKSPVLVGFD